MAASGLLAAALAIVVGLRLTREEAGPAEPALLVWPVGAGAVDGARVLRDAGLPYESWVLEVALLGTSLFIEPEPGPHVFLGPASALEVVRRLGRLSSRMRTKVVVPEGFNQFQVARRLERLGVCSEAAFLAAAGDRDRLDRLGVAGKSAEGYLFPATYQFGMDSAAADVLRPMVRLAQQRFERLAEQNRNGLERLEKVHGWGRTEVLTLASIIEKEAGVAEERPLIASVFLNRLEDPEFRPARMLQSDPTAGYGCLVDPALASCRDYVGRITPAMLRDASNPYNTYRRPGLPPGPVCNPGEDAIAAVLGPAQTDYLFFFANGDRRHAFSRTLAEHESAIEGKRRGSRQQRPNRDRP